MIPQIWSEQTYIRKDCAIFWKTREQYGALSNMAGAYPITVNGHTFPHTESLYQALRFPCAPNIQRLLQQTTNPVEGKRKIQIYKEQYQHPDWLEIRVDAMIFCLHLKISQHLKRIQKVLSETENKPIVEQSSRDNFWGAIPSADNRILKGSNVLGRLWNLNRELLYQISEGAPKLVGAISTLGLPAITEQEAVQQIFHDLATTLARRSGLKLFGEAIR